MKVGGLALMNRVKEYESTGQTKQQCQLKEMFTTTTQVHQPLVSKGRMIYLSK